MPGDFETPNGPENKDILRESRMSKLLLKLEEKMDADEIFSAKDLLSEYSDQYVKDELDEEIYSEGGIVSDYPQVGDYYGIRVFYVSNKNEQYLDSLEKVLETLIEKVSKVYKGVSKDTLGYYVSNNEGKTVINLFHGVTPKTDSVFYGSETKKTEAPSPVEERNDPPNLSYLDDAREKMHTTERYKLDDFKEKIEIYLQNSKQKYPSLVVNFEDEKLPGSDPEIGIRIQGQGGDVNSFRLWLIREFKEEVYETSEFKRELKLGESRSGDTIDFTFFFSR